MADTRATPIPPPGSPSAHTLTDPNTNPNPNSNIATDDLFSSIQNLEAQYHAEGYTLGSADGARKGQIEGRTFGLERAFEKFAELGRLGGRAAVWDARLAFSASGEGVEGEEEAKGKARVEVLTLKGSERLRRNVERLRELTDLESLSTVNDEESVNEFDGRLREAKAKATLVTKMIGEKDLDAADWPTSRGQATATTGDGAGKEMEDFAGLPFIHGQKQDGR